MRFAGYPPAPYAGKFANFYFQLLVLRIWSAPLLILRMVMEIFWQAKRVMERD